MMSFVPNSIKSPKKCRAFTLVELLVGVAILGIITVIALPSLNEFITSTKVDSEISELQRLILTARNTAINSESYVTICPLKDNKCNNNWQNELSVFTNSANTAVNAAEYTANSESIIRVKAAINNNDKLKFSESILIFSPTGRLVNPKALTFSYCPASDINLSRGVEVSLTGRISTTTNTDADTIEEFRSGAEVSC